MQGCLQAGAAQQHPDELPCQRAISELSRQRLRPSTTGVDVKCHVFLAAVGITPFERVPLAVDSFRRPTVARIAHVTRDIIVVAVCPLPATVKHTLKAARHSNSVQLNAIQLSRAAEVRRAHTPHSSGRRSPARCCTFRSPSPSRAGWRHRWSACSSRHRR